MCRLTAYVGPEIPLENIIVRPNHSLLIQSHDANEAKLNVNGDGFGIAWYGYLPEPGLYKDVLPAWSDANLPHICRLVRSRLFLAHVRASTIGGISRENCHPFVNGRWSFMHNGGIDNFEFMRRGVENLIDEDIYRSRLGNTDSELFFLLMLTNGLDKDPQSATERTISQFMCLAKLCPASCLPVHLTCVFSDGERIFGFRYASDGECPSLYMSESLDHGGYAFASEPLEGSSGRWHQVKPGMMVELSADRVRMTKLAVHALEGSALMQRAG